jgi:lipoprotein-anchoring transpeptidase ErfK/SrfK
MERNPRPWIAGAALVAVGLLGITLSGGDVPHTPRLGGALGDQGDRARPGHVDERPALAVTPAADAKNLPISTEIGTNVTNGKITEVTLREAGGGQVAGAMRPDGSSWLPSQALKYGKTYTGQVTASGADGQTVTHNVTFSTMKATGQQVDTTLYMRDGAKYGVAMPVAIQFDPEIPPSARAAVQRRLFVTSTPSQPGAWRWFTGRQVIYRPASYWKPGTQLTVRAALNGLPLGNGRYGDEDHAVRATIGSDFQMRVDNRTKSMSAYANGKLLKRIPVSMGKPSTPSSSGTMVVMTREDSTVFDTFAELGAAGYRVTVQWAERLTWGGEFIHSAPWSVWDQGRTNVSHGCINVSPSNAEWIYDHIKIGDPVTVRGTEHRLDPGNGWTAWDMSWKEYLKGAVQVR